MGSRGSVYSWCGCRDQRTGRRMGARCPRRGQPGHGSWYVSVELPPGPGPDRRRIRRGGFGDQAAAQSALKRLVMPAPGHPGDELVTTGQWLRHWLASRKTPRYSTMRGYSSHVRLYLEPCLGQILLADLRTVHIQAMLTAIARQRAAQDKPVTTATLARIKATLRAALNAATRAGYLADNRASRAEIPAGRRPRPIVWTGARVRDWEETRVRPPVAVWTPAQTAAFLNSIRSDRLCAVYHLIALRGLRRGEAAGLRRRDVDLDGGAIMICQQLQQYGGHLAVCPPKTGTSERAVALDRTTVSVLRRHHAAQEAERAAGGSTYHDSGYVFTAHSGDPIAPDNLSRRFRELSDAAGLPPVRLHDLRHGAATLALAAGAELKTVQDQLGHSSIVLTADTYISVLPEVARQAAEDSASLIIAAGYLAPGAARRRQPRPRHHPRVAAAGTASRAHPSRQIGHLNRSQAHSPRQGLSPTSGGATWPSD